MAKETHWDCIVSFFQVGLLSDPVEGIFIAEYEQGEIGLQIKVGSSS
jgi:hypothetical protein